MDAASGGPRCPPRHSISRGSTRQRRLPRHHRVPGRRRCRATGRHRRHPARGRTRLGTRPGTRNCSGRSSRGRRLLPACKAPKNCSASSNDCGTAEPVIGTLVRLVGDLGTVAAQRLDHCPAARFRDEGVGGALQHQRRNRERRTGRATASSGTSRACRCRRPARTPCRLAPNRSRSGSDRRNRYAPR